MLVTNLTEKCSRNCYRAMEITFVSVNQECSMPLQRDLFLFSFFFSFISHITFIIRYRSETQMPGQLRNNPLSYNTRRNNLLSFFPQVSVKIIDFCGQRKERRSKEWTWLNDFTIDLEMIYKTELKHNRHANSWQAFFGKHWNWNGCKK